MSKAKIRSFLWIFVKHLYLMLILLASDPFDLAERWFNMNYQPPQFLFWVLLFIAIGSAIYLSYRSYKGIMNKTQNGLAIARHCDSILENIEKRDLQLKDAVARQYKALFSFKDLLALCDSIARTDSKYVDAWGGIEKKHEDEELKQDKIQRHQQIDSMFEELRPLFEKEWTLELITGYGNELDRFPTMQNSKYKGIKTRREKDKRWSKLFTRLSAVKMEYPNIFADDELNEMIDEYIDRSFGASSLCFFIDLVNWYIPVDIQPTAYIHSGTYAPYTKLHSRMVRLRQNISNRIPELANEIHEEYETISKVKAESNESNVQ